MVYKVKSDIEWDLRFMGPLDKSWKDELVLLVMAYPLLGLMVPGLREPIIQGFEYLSKIDPSAPSIFTYGWATIFLATFGRNLTKTFTLPSKFATIIKALGASKPDVPDEAAEAAQDAVSPSPPTADKETQ